MLITQILRVKSIVSYASDWFQDFLELCSRGCCPANKEVGSRSSCFSASNSPISSSMFFSLVPLANNMLPLDAPAELSTDLWNIHVSCHKKTPMK